MTDDRQTRITISGLSPDEAELIKDAARLNRRTIRDWAIYHARNDAAEARWAQPATSKAKEG